MGQVKGHCSQLELIRVALLFKCRSCDACVCVRVGVFVGLAIAFELNRAGHDVKVRQCP